MTSRPCCNICRDGSITCCPYSGLHNNRRNPPSSSSGSFTPNRKGWEALGSSQKLLYWGGEEVLSSNTLGCLGAARETASTEAHQLPLLCLSVVVTLPCLEINIRLKLFITSRGWFLNCHVILCISIAMKFSSFDKLRIYKRDSPLSMSSLVWSLLGSC